MSAKSETGTTLLDQVRDFIAEYVVLSSDHYRDAVALWVAHAHAIAAADTTPRLILKSAEKESGKSRVLEVLEVLVPEALMSLNASVPAIFRLLKAKQPTFLMDEYDAIFKAKENEDLRALLNAGYRRGATIHRCVGEGKSIKVEQFPVFAATALAGLGDLPDTIESRAIVVPMHRRAPHEMVRSFRYREAEREGKEICKRLSQWAKEHHGALAAARPVMPDGVTDRAADCWEPLLAIADLASEGWAAGARAACKRIVTKGHEDDPSLNVQLLADIRTVLNDHDRMGSKVLADELCKLDESPWNSFGLDQRGLAYRLRGFEIRPKTIRLTDGTIKGYERKQFSDTWTRYLRPTSSETVTSVTAVTEFEFGDGRYGCDGGPTDVEVAELSIFDEANFASLAAYASSGLAHRSLPSPNGHQPPATAGGGPPHCGGRGADDRPSGS